MRSRPVVGFGPLYGNLLDNVPVPVEHPDGDSRLLGRRQYESARQAKSTLAVGQAATATSLQPAPGAPVFGQAVSLKVGAGLTRLHRPLAGLRRRGW